MPVDCPFDSRDVAAYIAQECSRRNLDYNNTKIQKLLYCAYGIMLAWRDDRICDEYPRLWPYGPVFPKVFKYINKGRDIAAYSFDFANGANADQKTVIAKTLERYGNYTASALSAWSHDKDSPWARVKAEGAGWNSFMPDEYIRDYFSEFVVER